MSDAGVGAIPTPSAREVLYGRALVVCAVILAASGLVDPAGGLDLLTFLVAERMVEAGLPWSEVYLPPDATTLFDVSDGYGQATLAYSDGVTRYTTGFVAPPPATWLGLGLGVLPWPIARGVWTGVWLMPVLWFAARDAAATTGLLLRGVVWVVCSATLGMAVALSQPSLLALPAAAGLARDDLWSRRMGAVFLGLVIVAKVGPVVVLPFLIAAGRRTEAGVALGVAASLVGLSWVVHGPEAWSAFAASLAQLTDHVVVTKANLSVDALLAHGAWGQPMGAWVEPSGLQRLAGTVLRVGLAGVLLARANAAAPRAHLVSGWLVWLALTPLQWAHYRVALVPLVAALAPRHPARAVLLALGLSCMNWSMILGAPDDVAMMLGALAWLPVAFLWPFPAEES